MSKKFVTLNRHELVWETRSMTWGEQEYLDLLDWLKGLVAKDSGGNWYRRHQQAYEILANLSWDHVADILEGREPDIMMTITNQGYTGGDWTYEEGISEYIMECIREDCYDADVTDSNYADDYEEDWDFEGFEEKPEGND